MQGVVRTPARRCGVRAPWTGWRQQRSGGSGSVLRAAWIALALVAWIAPTSARAFEFFDGRLAVHGFYEFQLRSIARNFDPDDGFDVTQMANILNLEIEADLAPDGFGPFDLVTVFSRIEVRYDCVWSGGCGTFPSIETFGNDIRRLPKRLEDGRRLGHIGAVPDGDIRYFRGEPGEEFRWIFRGKPRGSRKPFQLGSVNGFDNFSASPGPDGIQGTDDDPGPFFFSRYLARPKRCLFTSRYAEGPVDGNAAVTLGPLDPNCRPEPIAGAADKPNPFRGRDFNPLLVGQAASPTGSGELPYRPATRVGYLTPAPPDVPRGLWIPNPELRRRLREGRVVAPPHFSQHDLQWNRGFHQDTWRELKELYVDLEMFDSRLWLRLGKQTIVWGKTELFRNQDQFNPQDLALASLPTLEESRTALWSARGIWSFYDVGPLQDVRVELAVNFDRVMPGDFGQCGEPYTVYLVCAGAFGQLAHGIQGLGFAGIQEIEDPWNDIKGVEVGGRLEWRWDRFSFALTDYWGWDDFPTIERIYTYSRNVDPVSGRPRRGMSDGHCRTGRERDCLGSGGDALMNHHANQTLFATSCAATLGIAFPDPTKCGFTVFNSLEAASETNALAPALSIFFAAILSGQGGAPGTDSLSGGQFFDGLAGFNSRTYAALSRFPNVLIQDGTGGLGEPNPPPLPTPLVPLSLDPGDTGMPVNLVGTPFEGEFVETVTANIALGPFLTDAQQALLGCGAFYRTVCDIDGFDLLNMEASAIFQSWVGIDGTYGNWSTTDASRAQPGTVGFRGGPVCTRRERGRTFILPGCRGPGDPGYDPRVDGSASGPAAATSIVLSPTAPFQRVHPFTGQPFRSEMAVLSWNFMMMLVGFSRGEELSPEGTRPPVLLADDDEFDPNFPFRNDACSFAKPQFCSAFRGFWAAIATTRNTVEAGGNGQFGRRDFIWHHGNPVIARFDKHNTLGFSVDFAEDLTKTNWSFEATWVANVALNDADKASGLTNVDLFNLTISVDRPTFINFLNANRTFFFNSQLFIRYTNGYSSGFPSPGPWNFLFTLTGQTGYFQDRLLAGSTFVYDKRSNSGAILPSVTYRFNERFSATVGIALFFGRFEQTPMSVNPIASRNRTGPGAYQDSVERGLSVVRHRDEAYLRIRYTF
ncbi:MAG: hypothetical protein QNK05_10460 [Myxococcota bacterium]|nr:hypothetical protein [Myxococcota bacterium]